MQYRINNCLNSVGDALFSGHCHYEYETAKGCTIACFHGRQFQERDDNNYALTCLIIILMNMNITSMMHFLCFLCCAVVHCSEFQHGFFRFFNIHSGCTLFWLLLRSFIQNISSMDAIWPCTPRCPQDPHSKSGNVWYQLMLLNPKSCFGNANSANIEKWGYLRCE